MQIRDEPEKLLQLLHPSQPHEALKPSSYTDRRTVCVSLSRWTGQGA